MRKSHIIAAGAALLFVALTLITVRSVLREEPGAATAMAMAAEPAEQAQEQAPAQQEQAAEAPSAQPPADAATFTARPAAREVTLTAFTRARTSLTLVTEESGRVERVAADVGDAIGEDGVFAELDTTYIKLDLAANRAEQARLKHDEAYYDKERRRYETLVREKNAAQSVLDEHNRNHVTAQQQLRALTIEEQRLLERLERHTIAAPPGWLVASRSVEPGQWVNTGQTVGTVGNFDRLLVPFALTQQELAILKRMERISLRFPDKEAVGAAEDAVTVPARIERISPDYDPETRKIAVDLEVDEAPFPLRGGLRAELVLPLPDPGGAVEVPATALTRAYEDWFLTRPDGERVRVVFMGHGAEGMRRVSSPDVRAGDVFLEQPTRAR